jgi:Mg2+-importing ATPase
MICKGEFHSILQICSRVLIPGAGTAPLEDYLEQLTKFRQQSGSDGLRSILVAYRDLSRAEIHKSDESGMILAGFVLFEDPVKPGVSAVLNELHRMRVGLKILSGDSLPVVLSVASRIGMNNCSVITGPQLDASTADALAHILERNSLFAELEPRHKERIIRELRKKHILAYMGDGINDVSALHEADVGISVSNAAGIAIEASDFVLLKKDLSVIADGIREGRRTFANTLKYIYISTGSTFGNMFSVAMASLYLPFIPMLPKQILLTNFISDFPFLSVASDSVDPAQLQRPGRWRLSQIRNFMWVFGLHSSVFDWITFSFLEFGMHAAPTDFRTAWFMESVATELLILFVVRTHRPFYRSRPATGLLWLSIAAISCTFLLPFTPLAEGLGFRTPSLPVLGGISGILMAYLFTADALKIWFFRQKN